MISLTKPANFDKPMQVVGCFIENDGKILLLHRHSNKPEGSTWCSPGGKVEPTDQNLVEAIKREVFEETGIIANTNDYKFITTFYVSYANGKNFIYHKFKLPVLTATIKTDESEHQNHAWFSPIDAIKLPLIQHEGDTIKHAYKIS